MILVIICIFSFEVYNCISRLKFHKILKPFIENIPNNNKILDFGSSNGLLKKYFIKKDIINLDIDGPLVTDNVIKYDGHNIPFPDNHFHTTVVMFVLHHIPHQNEILDEIKRVTKNNIIVIEDIIDESPNVKLATFLIKKHYGMFKQSQNHIKLQHNQKEWLDIFKKKNLKVIDNIKIKPSFLYLVSHRLFKLQKLR